MDVGTETNDVFAFKHLTGDTRKKTFHRKKDKDTKTNNMTRLTFFSTIRAPKMNATYIHGMIYKKYDIRLLRTLIHSEHGTSQLFFTLQQLLITDFGWWVSIDHQAVFLP
jgi:hypothetical protein